MVPSSSQLLSMRLGAAIGPSCRRFCRDELHAFSSLQRYSPAADAEDRYRKNNFCAYQGVRVGDLGRQKGEAPVESSQFGSGWSSKLDRIADLRTAVRVGSLSNSWF